MTTISLKARAVLGLQKAWRVLPARWRLVFWERFGLKVRNFVDLQMVARPASGLPQSNKHPLVVAGLFRTANGIGEGARGTYHALDAAGLNPIAVDLSEQLSLVDMDTDIPLHPMPEDKYGTLIMQLNGPETVAGLQHLKMTRGRQWHTIGYWAWELPVFPKGWDRAFPFLSEIWAVSEFTAKAIRSHEAAPTVSVFGHAVLPPPTVASDRAKFGLPRDAFIFLTLADSMSSLNRKNPFTAIAAHKAAFHGDEDVHLVIKTRNLGRSASAKADLLAAIGDAENIHVMDQSLSPQARWDLFGTSDCIISLHRSEGFGLALAEAMALQKPVIATAWSGNMDFTTPENAYLADFTLVPCEDNYGVYNDSSTVWADVSVEEAARLMREVYTKPKARKARAKAGRTYIKDSASPKRLGEKFAQRLKDLS